MWLQINDQNQITLLPCEGSYQCVDAGNFNCSTQKPAICGKHHTGFLCAECDPGYVKLDGRCSPCTDIQWRVVVAAIVSALLIACWMLFQSMTLFCPESLARDVFRSLDQDKNGFLDDREIRLLIEQIGDPLHVFRSDKAIEEMTGKPLTEGSSTEVTVPQFAAWCRLRQPPALASICTLFFQAAAIVGAKSGLHTQALSFLNLNPSEALGKCLAPGMPLMTPLLIPLVLSAMILLLVVAVHSLLKRWIELQQHHRARAMTNTFCASYKQTFQPCFLSSV